MDAALAILSPPSDAIGKSNLSVTAAAERLGVSAAFLNKLHHRWWAFFRGAVASCGCRPRLVTDRRRSVVTGGMMRLRAAPPLRSRRASPS